MQFFLTSFGMHNPYIIARLPEHALYPISCRVDEGIDLDYTSLLLGKQYFVDSDAYEYVCSESKAFLAPMAKTLAFLKQEGYLETIDTREIIERNRSVLHLKVEAMAARPQEWVEVIRKQWRILKEEYVVFHRAHGQPANEFLNTSLYPVLNYLVSIGEEDNIIKYNEITRIFESRRGRFSAQEEEYIREVAKPLLAQILINDLVRCELNSPVLDWDDSEFYYDQLHLYRWDKSYHERTLIMQERKLFECVIPSLKPKNIQEVVRFVSNDKAVESLRRELWKCIENENEVSDEWYRDFVDRILRHELNMKKNMKRFRWLGAFAGALIPGGGFVQEAAIEIAQNLAEDEIERRLELNYEWFYALQKEVGRRKI